VRRHQQIARLQEHGRHQQNRRHAGIGQNGARAPSSSASARCTTSRVGLPRRE
jgi:hypothetical protein